jgi:hypothetical protein
MIIPDVKKTAMVVLSKLDKPEGATEVKEEAGIDEDPAELGMRSAAEDMMEAFHSRSVNDLMKAMSNFMSMYGTSGK